MCYCLVVCDVVSVVLLLVVVVIVMIVRQSHHKLALWESIVFDSVGDETNQILYQKRASFLFSQPV